MPTYFPFAFETLAMIVAEESTKAREKLKFKGRVELEHIVRFGAEIATANRSRGELLDAWEMAYRPEEVVEARVAFELIAANKGRDYALALVGLREPETFLEKAEVVFLGKYPLAA